jgi:hypothetical protein
MDRWAAHPKQTSELIKRALGLFRQFEEQAPSDATGILSDWRKERRFFDDYTWKGNNPDEKSRTAAETGFVRWCLPWELLRLQRLQDAMFAAGLDEIQLVDRQLRDRGFVDADLIDKNAAHAPWKWDTTTFGPPTDATDAGWLRTLPENRVDRAALARMHFLVWAALDYRRQHQRLPAALSELVPAYFDWLPVDPWTGQDFLYKPEGVPINLHAAGLTVQRNEPFVASGGIDGCRIEFNTERKVTIDGVPVSSPAPVRVVNRSGRDMSNIINIDYPAPILPVPSPVLPSAPTAAPPMPPTKPPSDKPLAKPAGNLPADKGPPKPGSGKGPPASPLDHLFTKPAVEPPAGKVPSKK